MDTLIIVLVALTQGFLGYMGFHIALNPPREGRKWYWAGAFIAVCLAGIVLTGWLGERASNAQEQANSEIHRAQVAATNANTAATNANNAALSAQAEVKQARDEARIAQDQLTKLINQKSSLTGRWLDNRGE